jgi:hypothetical protein
MRYEVMLMPGHRGEWVAQAIGPDGEIYRAIFDYRDAKHRAEEYAAWKNAANTTSHVTSESLN